MVLNLVRRSTFAVTTHRRIVPIVAVLRFMVPCTMTARRKFTMFRKVTESKALETLNGFYIISYSACRIIDKN